jgi:hypothetical protein
MRKLVCVRQACGSHGGTRSSVHFTPGRVQNMPDCLRCARDACAYWAGAVGIPGVAAPISFRQVQTNQIQTGIQARPDQKNISYGISACDMQSRHRRAQGAVNANRSRGRQWWTGRGAVRAPRWRRLRPKPKYRARFEPKPRHGKAREPPQANGKGRRSMLRL